MRVFRSTADQAHRPGLITYAPVRSWANELGVPVLVEICCLTNESPSSTPHPQINVELSRLCKTGACIKKAKRCTKKTFSYFSTVQRWPPPQLHMAGHNNRATKTIQKPFTSRWQLSLFAQKTHQNQRFSAARAHSFSSWLPNLSESAIAPENAEIAIPRCRPLPPKSMLDCIIACPPRCCHGPDTTSQH